MGARPRRLTSRAQSAWMERTSLSGTCAIRARMRVMVATSTDSLYCPVPSARLSVSNRSMGTWLFPPIAESSREIRWEQ